jgi:hypothetical protein
METEMRVRWSHFVRLCVLCALVLAGCASAAVTQQAKRAPVDYGRPTQIVVYPFAANPDEVTLNQSIIQRAYRGATGDNENAEQLQIAHDTAQAICQQVVTDLTANGYNAVCAQRGTFVAGGNILIVDGALTNISEGNRLRRLVVGFGTGASTLDSNVSMYQRIGGNLNQVLAFSTHADSGKMPGAAVMAPVGVAAGDRSHQRGRRRGQDLHFIHQQSGQENLGSDRQNGDRLYCAGRMADAVAAPRLKS